jgi:hypothetical protein
VVSSCRLLRIEAEDGRVNTTGCIGLFYSKITVFYVLGTKDNLVFTVLLGPINRTLKGYNFLSFLIFLFALSRV